MLWRRVEEIRADKPLRSFIEITLLGIMYEHEALT